MWFLTERYPKGLWLYKGHGPFFLAFLWKACHAIVVFNNTTKEQYQRRNEGGIFYIFENYTKKTTHINPKSCVVCHRFVVNDLKGTPPWRSPLITLYRGAVVRHLTDTIGRFIDGFAVVFGQGATAPFVFHLNNKTIHKGCRTMVRCPFSIDKICRH